MSEQINVVNEDGKAEQHYVDQLPDWCPLCRQNASLQKPHGAIRRRPDTIEAVFRCPGKRCSRLFIAYYRWVGGLAPYRLFELQPSSPNPVHFGEGIEKLSPDFVEVGNQAREAERFNLHAIAGPGYRKALEYLIKDYIIDKKPDQSDAIKRTALDNCIKHHIDDPRIRTCAQRATWLGNDETHYLRKWDAHDIKDLKILINLTVNWIKSDLLTEQYGDSMNKPTK